MKERVLITGASGFVGYHLIKEALDNNLEVFAGIRKSSSVAHLKDFDIRYSYPDFDNVDLLKKDLAENNYDYVVHAAGVTKAITPTEYEHVNAGYTRNLATASAESSNVKKFVLVGSLAAIGPLSDIEGTISEQTPPRPVTAYGRSKLHAENILREIKGLNYTVLRPTGVYGPRDKDIFIFFQQLVRGIEPYIGRSPQKFSFIYVADLAQAAIKALFKGDGQIYNLSDGGGYDRYELGKITKDVLHLSPLKFHLPVNFVRFIAFIAEKYSSLSRKASALNVEKLNELTAVNWYCDIEKAKKELGYLPRYDLATGVAETLLWYKANNWL